MAFMRPTAAYFTESEANEYAANPDCPDERIQAGWFGRLSAPGYLDCTEWDGPYLTEVEALDAIKRTFEVDNDGECDA